MRKLGFLFSALTVWWASFSACIFTPQYNNARFSCTSDLDCPTSFKCNGGLCASPNAGTCTKNEDCATGQACVAGACLAPDSGNPTCTNDAACGVGGYCIQSACYRGAQGDRCTETVQCQTNHICQPVGAKTLCVKQCQRHEDCQPQDSCRPSLTGGDAVCVPGCDVVTQQGCSSTEVCVLFNGRGYCQERRGNSRLSQLCKQDADCELHLYCRPVKGFPTIRRCTNVCNSSTQSGCATAGQACVALPETEKPYGFCEPIPTEVGAGEICSGDLICKAGFSCKREGSDPFSRCR